MSNIIVTGVAGFIGSKVCQQLLSQNKNVIGIDNLNSYYSVLLKKHRLEQLKKNKNFTFIKLDIENKNDVFKLIKKYKPQAVINLAARAGVRYSIENPFIYVSTNVEGVLNLLEACRKNNVKKFVLASTSSLYAGQKMPFSETLPVNTPISPYAATKKSAEALCYSYSYLFGLDVTVLRYFTVYGPASRPDMGIFKFIKLINNDMPIEVFGDGTQSRDFTYVDDIARATIKATSLKGFNVINVGNNNPQKLSRVIALIEQNLGKKAVIKKKPFHKADMVATWANISLAKKLLGWKPTVTIEEGIKNTVKWHIENTKLVDKC